MIKAALFIVYCSTLMRGHCCLLPACGPPTQVKHFPREMSVLCDLQALLITDYVQRVRMKSHLSLQLVFGFENRMRQQTLFDATHDMGYWVNERTRFRSVVGKEKMGFTNLGPYHSYSSVMS